MMVRLTVVVWFLLSLVGNGLAQEVLGCGGFVKSSKSNIDLSRIQIGLFEKRGSNLRKVESTDCAPNNGYYFLPVSSENRGLFVLKALPPRGWKVEPSEFEVDIDGDNDQCSQGIDINFEFIGFGITGSVLSKGSSKGPADIKVNLIKSTNSVLASAFTDSDGKFDFFGVSPGDYEVQIAKEFQELLAIDAISRKVHVGEDVGNVPAFNILGYAVQGKVVGPDRKSALSGVTFELFQYDGSTKGSPIAKASSDAHGILRFPKVPVGQYAIAVSKAMESTLILGSNEQIVEVGHENAHFDDFVVKSFSMSGKVMTGTKPLPGVKLTIEVQGSKVEKTSGQDGSYALSGISSGPIVLKAVMEGYDFNALTIDKVEPGLALPDYKPTRYRLSGNVDRSGFTQEITVRFNNERGDTIGRVSVTEKGQFSIYLPTGEYFVAVEVSASEQANVGFAPLEHKAKVVDKPLVDLNFHAIKADIEGRAHCLESKCGEGLIVTLSIDGVTSQQAPVADNGSFKFIGVLPATYTISISDGGRCWQEPVKKISVAKDVKDVVFKQVGYFVTVESTRATLMTIHGINSKQSQEVVISQGNNVICVKGQDKEVTLATKGCEEFQISPDVLNLGQLLGVVVNLKPVKYSVSGRILSKKKIPNLQLIAKSESRQVNLDVASVPEGYSFDLMAFPGEELIFTPQSADHLFAPESLHVFVDHDCHLEVAVFNANPGYFVKGQISPPVEGVEITITNADPSLKYTQTTTDKSGQYSLGPLPEGEYTVEASKEGYVFEKTSAYGFKSNKLASILVKLADTDKNPLDSVVVSVSGGKYRSNTMSIDGSAEFLSLAPGEYFIKPQLKEYEFEPKHTLQKLKEGENAEIVMTAKRVAFSIFGKMVSLNGQPEPSITLKAVSKDCEEISEEAMTESDGTFRFRGLRPKCEYTIALLHGESIEKLIPKEVKVRMAEKDHTLGKSIVAMRAFETMDILLKVTEEDGKFLTPSNLKISMSSADHQGFSFNTKAVTGQLVTLPRVPKDQKKYNIHVETVPDKFAGQKKVSHTLVADDYFKSVRLVLNKTTTATKPTRKASSLVYILPLIIGAILSYILWDQMPLFIKKLGSTSASQSGRVSSGGDHQSASDDGWDVTATPSGGKRKSKKR